MSAAPLMSPASHHDQSDRSSVASFGVTYEELKDSFPQPPGTQLRKEMDEVTEPQSGKIRREHSNSTSAGPQAAEGGQYDHSDDEHSDHDEDEKAVGWTEDENHSSSPITGPNPPKCVDEASTSPTAQPGRRFATRHGPACVGGRTDPEVRISKNAKTGTALADDVPTRSDDDRAQPQTSWLDDDSDENCQAGRQTKVTFCGSKGPHETVQISSDKTEGQSGAASSGSARQWWRRNMKSATEFTETKSPVKPKRGRGGRRGA